MRLGFQRAPVVPAGVLEESQGFRGAASVVEHAGVGSFLADQGLQDLQRPARLARLDIEASQHPESGFRSVWPRAKGFHDFYRASQITCGGERQGLRDLGGHFLRIKGRWRSRQQRSHGQGRQHAGAAQRAAL